MKKLYVISLLCLSVLLPTSAFASDSHTIYGCQGEGKYKDVYLSGYKGRSFGGPYACLGDKNAYSSVGTRAAVRIDAEEVYNQEERLTVQKTNYYDNGNGVLIKETIKKKTFSIGFIEWIEWDSKWDSEFEPKMEDATFNCRILTGGENEDVSYFTPCQSESQSNKRSETTSNIISGNSKPLTAAELALRLEPLIQKHLNGSRIEAIEDLLMDRPVN